jgi:hypothetical protein
MSDLLYCVMIGVDKTIYRYTQDTRRKDMYVKHRNYLRTEKRRGGRQQERERVGSSTKHVQQEEDDIFASIKVYVEKKMR